MPSRIGSIAISSMVILASCSNNGSGATTTAESITTTTESGPSEACVGEPATPIHPEAFAMESIVVDLDGDGFDDIVTGYLLGSETPEAAAAVIHLELGSGWGTDLRIDELSLADGAAMAEPRAVVNLADDHLIVAGVAGTASRRLFAFFAFENCRLGVVSTSRGEVPEIWVGGGRTHDDWFVCDSDRVLMVQFGTSSPDAEPRTYGAGAAQTFEYADGEFTRARSSDLDAALPATREEMARIYPPCVD